MTDTPRRDDQAAIRHLRALADALQQRGFKTELQHPEGRIPSLRVFSTKAADLTEFVVVDQGASGDWYLWSWARKTAPELSLIDADEREAFRQAGVLLRRFHRAAPARYRADAAEGIISRAGKHLIEASERLGPGQADLVGELCGHLAQIAPDLPETPAHGDAQPRNFVWDAASRRLALIDFERAEWAPPVRDLTRLEYGAFDGRPDLRAAFFDGYGRALTEVEECALRGFAALDAVSGIRWGPDNDDAEVTARSRRTLVHLGGTDGTL